MLPLFAPLQVTLVTCAVTPMMRTVTTWSAAPARMQASPPMMRRMKVFCVKGPTSAPGRSWAVAPGISFQVRLSVLICHWYVAALPSEG